MKSRSRYGLFAAALLFSTGGAAIKATSLSSWQVAGFRSGIAAVVLAIALPGARRGWTWRTALIGVAYAATLILFVAANKLTTSANAIFLQSTAPLYLLLLGPLLLHEPVRRRDVAVMAAVFAGILLLFSGTETTVSTAPNPHLGNVIGAVCGLSWALTLAGLRWMGDGSGGCRDSDSHRGQSDRVRRLPANGCPLGPVSPGDISAISYLGVFQVGLAYVFLTRSIRHVPGLEAATLLLVEPVFNPIWTWLMHGERPSPEALVGGAVIIGAATVGNLRSGE